MISGILGQIGVSKNRPAVDLSRTRGPTIALERQIDDMTVFITVFSIAVKIGINYS